MATGISTAFVTLFDAEVKQAYQAESMLRNAVRLRTGVEGSTYKFPKISAGAAVARGTLSSDVTALGITYAQATATMSDWVAAEYTDIFGQTKVNFDERSELVQIVGKSIGRRSDQLVLTALDAASTSLTVGTDVGGTGTNLNLDKLLEAKRLMDAGNVPASERFFVIHANNLAGLLAETKVTSSDYANVKALVQGQVDTFMGFKFMTMGDLSEGGLPLATGVRTNYAFHKSAIGLAESLGPKTEINYVPQKTSWLVNCMYSAGSVGIDGAGIVEVACTE